MSDNHSATISLYEQLFNHLPEPICVFDNDDNEVFTNSNFEWMGDDFKQEMLNQWAARKTKALKHCWVNNRLVRFASFEHGYAFVVSDTDKENSIAEVTLRKLSEAMRYSDDIYAATAEAISESLSWRWVAITRFKSKHRLEVLTFLDNHERMQETEYDIVGTPCEMVVDTNSFTLFSDVLAAFPNYQSLHEMGAKTYAGLVYRGADNQPLGHVMVMHDKRDVDFALAEDVISIATLALASHFQLHNAKSQLKEVQKQAKVDALTGIGNRLAYDSVLNYVESTQHLQRPHDWTIAIIDLDGLKPLNDNVGHNAGDQFIRLMATELDKIGRQDDHAFRIGGDEFAVIFSQSTPAFISSLIGRFHKAIHRVRTAMQYPVNASIGFASLNEAENDIEKWIALADQRMYRNKKSKKESQSNVINI